MAWDDAIALASTDNSDTIGDYTALQPVTCTQTGSCTKLRIGCRDQAGANENVKVALYDNANNLLGQGVVTGVQPASGTYQEVTLDSPVDVTASTSYTIGWSIPVPFIRTGYVASGDVGLDFGTTYSEFPADPCANPTGVARTYAVGMWVEAAAGGGGPLVGGALAGPGLLLDPFLVS